MDVTCETVFCSESGAVPTEVNNAQTDSVSATIEKAFFLVSDGYIYLIAKDVNSPDAVKVNQANLNIHYRSVSLIEILQALKMLELRCLVLLF